MTAGVPAGPVLPPGRGLRRPPGAAPRPCQAGRAPAARSAWRSYVIRSPSSTPARPCGGRPLKSGEARPDAVLSELGLSQARDPRPPPPGSSCRAANRSTPVPTSSLPDVERRHRLDHLQQPREAQRPLDRDAARALPRALAAFDDDPEVRVIVITGAGEQGVRVRGRHLASSASAARRPKPGPTYDRARARPSRRGATSVSRSSP